MSWSLAVLVSDAARSGRNHV